MIICKKYIAAVLAAGITAAVTACGTADSEPAEDQAADIEHGETEDDDSESAESPGADFQDDEPSADSEESSPSGMEAGELTVSFLDVGQGDATLFQTEEVTVLVDAGRHDRSDVTEHLEHLGVEEIDILAGTHPHADHIGQMPDVIDSFDVHEVWMSGGEATSQVFERTIDAIMSSDASYDEPRAGDVFEVGGLIITIVHPENLTGDLNDDSLSMNIAYGEVNFLLTGDAEEGAEARMIERNEPLEAEILKAGHHGSSTSSTPAFAETVNPEIAVYSAGENNQYGHPHDEVRLLFSEMDIPFYGTAEHGTVTVITDGAGYEVHTEHDASSFYDENEGETGGEENEPGSEETAAADSDCIDVNTASPEELENIIHLGEARVQSLIDKRPFDSVSSLTRISGIGDARVQEILDEGLACTS
ncbi:MBL fold metallo-hydrolase [Alteribacter natronophilus]|uniref:MBL fold metallo-hydrolase n=1 Tax=Alteribacter natronophilus TaxID=2583810 RepID=UPI001485EA64|nr:MBL fold metallo-hydrolase [Alteribacter natronophilus]